MISGGFNDVFVCGPWFKVGCHSDVFKKIPDKDTFDCILYLHWYKLNFTKLCLDADHHLFKKAFLKKLVISQIMAYGLDPLFTHVPGNWSVRDRQLVRFRYTFKPYKFVYFRWKTCLIKEFSSNNGSGNSELLRQLFADECPTATVTWPASILQSTKPTTNSRIFALYRTYFLKLHY
jgi:hypothetical protein